MKWLGLLLLYFISTYIKKRQQNQKRQQIESDPGWDSEKDAPPQEPGQKLDQLLNDLFDQGANLDPESVPIPIQTEDSELIDGKKATEEEIIKFCKETLAGFKLPKKVVFSALPKTSTGKIQKFVLRKKAKELN